MTGKVEISIAIDPKLLKNADAMQLGFSEVLEHALCRLGCEPEHERDTRRAQWLEQNRDAIAASNKELEINGPWYTPDGLAE